MYDRYCSSTFQILVQNIFPKNVDLYGHTHTHTYTYIILNIHVCVMNILLFYVLDKQKRTSNRFVDSGIKPTVYGKRHSQSYYISKAFSFFVMYFSHNYSSLIIFSHFNNRQYKWWFIIHTHTHYVAVIHYINFRLV